ncbi:MAG: hypothetical protein A3K61_05470 [Thaumarchaeota archaeon RBG_16_49_8]|nr:MAG: hypothetical protein A3K61_05470 [Thaumarchaeota archaeon RBG_16_49_8]
MALSDSKRAHKVSVDGHEGRRVKTRKSSHEGKNEVRNSLTQRNLELEDELYRARNEINALRKELQTYVSVEEMIQKLCEPIINQIVNDFQNVWAQRIATQVEENVRHKLNQDF